jgi:putative DNA primase/helicase
VALLLSGDGQESLSINVELLGDIKKLLGDKAAIFSGDLAASLAKDPERPWAEWKHGKPLSQKQLAGLLKPFKVTSQTVRIGDDTSKGYYRTSFEPAWKAYLPGQNPSSGPIPASETSQRHNSYETGTSCIFRSVTEVACDGSGNGDLFNNHGRCDAVTDGKPESAPAERF